MKIYVVLNTKDGFTTEITEDNLTNFFKEIASGREWITTKDAIFKSEDVVYIKKDISEEK